MPIGIGTYEVSWNETYGGGTTGLTETADTNAVTSRVYVGPSAGLDTISSGETIGVISS